MEECLTNGIFYIGQSQASPMILAMHFSDYFRCGQYGEDPAGHLCEMRLRQNILISE